MVADLKERERVVLEIIDGLGGRTSFEVIETMIRAQYRKHLRTALQSLAEYGFVLRYPPGMYALTGSGREALVASSGNLMPSQSRSTAPVSSLPDPA